MTRRSAVKCRLNRGCFASQVLHLGCLVGGVVVEHRMHVAWPRDGTVDAAQALQELPGSVGRGRHSPITMPDFTSSAANNVVVPWRLSSWVIVAARRFLSGSPGRVRSSACILDPD